MTDNTYYHDVTGIPRQPQGAQEAATDAATDGAQDCAPAANTAAEEAQDASQGTTEGAADGVETVIGEVEINTPTGYMPKTAEDVIKAAAGRFESIIYTRADLALQEMGVADTFRDEFLQHLYAQQFDPTLEPLDKAAKECVIESHGGFISARTIEGVCGTAVSDFLVSLDDEQRKVDGETLAENKDGAMQLIGFYTRIVNNGLAKGESRFTIPRTVNEHMMVILLAGVPEKGIHGILPDGMLCMVSMYTDPGKAEIMIRNDRKDSDNYGVYTVAKPRGTNELKRIIFEVAGAKDSHYINTVFDALPARLERRKMSHDPNRWVPCDNGVYDLKEDRFIPYDSDEYKRMGLIFVWKHHTKYDEHAADVVPTYTDEEGNTIDIEQVIADMAVDEFGNPSEGIRQQIWEVLDTVARPGVTRGKVAMLHGEMANDGKSTLRKLAISMTGEANVCTFQPDAFEKDFALASLVNPTYKPLIYPDDTTYARIENSANFKSFVTGDPVGTDQKYGDMVTINTDGMSMVLNCNDLPSTREKGFEITRRFHIIEMRSAFGRGNRKEIHGIKRDFVGRPDVSEYVIYRCIHMDHKDEYTVTEDSAAALDEWVTSNDSVAAYMKEMLTPEPYMVWGEEDPTAPGNFRMIGVGDSYTYSRDDDGKPEWDYLTRGGDLVIVEYNMTGVYYDTLTPELNYEAFKAWYRVKQHGREDRMPQFIGFSKSVKTYLASHPGMWEYGRQTLSALGIQSDTRDMTPMQAIVVDAINERVRLNYQKSKQCTVIKRCEPTRMIRKYSLGKGPEDPKVMIYGEDDTDGTETA